MSPRPTEGLAGGLIVGATDKKHRIMSLPDKTTAPNRARVVRIHELLHAKLSPCVNIDKLVKKLQVKPSDIQVAEDLRINTAGLTHLDQVDEQSISEEELENLAKALSETKVLSTDQMVENAVYLRLTTSTVQKRSINGRKCGHLFPLRPMTRESRILSKAIEKCKGKPGQAERLDAINELAEKLAETALNATIRKIKGGRGGKYPFGFTKTLAQELRKLLKDASEAQLGKPDAKVPYGTSFGKWGKLVDAPKLPLTRHLTHAQPMRNVSATQAGRKLGHPRRLLIDQKVFKRTTYRQSSGGTVLIDTSGSMNLDGEKIASAIKACPRATVAIYSGHTTPLQGSISIIAQKGRMAEKADIHQRIAEVGGGNIIDGPALEWLAKQEEPRIWVCDGHVTGEGDQSFTNLDIEAQAITKRGNITRIDNCEDILSALCSPH